MPGNTSRNTKKSTGKRHQIKARPKRRYLPINLARKFQRERRIRNGGIGVNRRKNRSKLERRSKDFETSELDALIHASEMQLKVILEQDDVLSDIPFDVIPEELEGEIALAQGGGTIIYIERDGLSTLKVVLPQDQPTIAQLKKAIAAQANIQLKRELRERHEERIRRRTQNVLQHATGSNSTSTPYPGGSQLWGKDDNNHTPANTESSDNNKEKCQEQDNVTRKKTRETMAELKSKPSIRLTGELVCSAAHNGHQHRPCVSWRYLWRAYALFDPANKTLINDENGRKLLSECGIENAQTLRFTKREKYLGKKRQ
ncbi:uncharacterized protein LOC101900037 [Musca domestica]|uniref:Uncharacterized protein LOC101900037 n=1 Tax=Musca domestica TaxID=7370 RepID=A0ABM3VFV5_MUSDO|nr:uncharacterized protein LOC101900037 [Musca domestica]